VRIGRKILAVTLRTEAFLLSFLLVSCQTITRPTVSNGLQVSPEAAERAKTEATGSYFIGRRLVGQHFYFWGYVKRPGESWDRAKLVMLNENLTLAPDRARHAIGSDNNCEYRLYGYFSGDHVYEAASGRFFPEFVLKKAELIDSRPPAIFLPNIIEEQKMFVNWPTGTVEPGVP
jgi:hypothetical protein